MPIDDEVVIRRVVVKAHSSFANSRAGERRNEFAEEISTTLDERLTDFIGECIRIDPRAFQVIGDFHRAVVMDRESVEAAFKLEKNRERRRFKAPRGFSRWFEVGEFLPRGRELV